MTNTAAQTAAREGRELGDLRTRWSDAVRSGELARGERPSFTEAALDRMGELVLAGDYRTARIIHLREFQKGN